MVREFVLQLKLGNVDSEYFLTKFGVDVKRAFASQLQELAQAGWLTVNEKGITLRRDGLLRADRLLSKFYLPQHQDCEYR